MKTAIVTGASSGIGKAIAEVLVKNGYEVYGIGRNFTEDVRFHAIVCDLLDEKQYQAMMLSLPKEIDVLVNNAGCAYYGMHETISDARIHEMIKLNLEIPERMSQHYIRALRLRQGLMINVASITGTHPSPHAACYASTKAAMISFSNSIFEENRKHGVKVTCLIPDMTETNLYRNADFKADENDGCCLIRWILPMLLNRFSRKEMELSQRKSLFSHNFIAFKRRNRQCKVNSVYFFNHF